MACRPITGEGGVRGYVCGPRSRGKRCRWCTREHTLLCDHPLEGGRTCDAPMCRDHAHEVGPDRHLCPDHRPGREAPPPAPPAPSSGPREPLQALTLWQPWASAIAAGVKLYENRTWAPARLRERPPRPMWTALHAGATVDRGLSRPERGYRFGRGWSMLRDLWPGLPGGRDYPWPRGFLGLVRYDVAEPYVDGEPCRDDPWCSGPWCWRVGRVVLLPEPIPLNGGQGLWNVPDELLPTFRDLLRANPETR